VVCVCELLDVEEIHSASLLSLLVFEGLRIGFGKTKRYGDCPGEFHAGDSEDLESRIRVDACAHRDAERVESGFSLLGG
jgi:hypothetical protein